MDYAKGFGGKYGVAQKSQDKSAVGYEQQPEAVGTNYQRVKPDTKADIKSLKNRFENTTQEETRKRAEEIRNARLDKEKLEREMEEKRRAQEQMEAEHAKPATKSVASAELAKLNTVSSSPFKAGSQAQRPTNGDNEVVKSQPIGKIKLNSPFLQNNQPNSTAEPTPSSVAAAAPLPPQTTYETHSNSATDTLG